VCGALLLLALAVAGCTAAGGQPRTEATSTFACVTPHHVCPSAFDVDLRQKGCTCQGEPGRFHYTPKPH